VGRSSRPVRAKHEFRSTEFESVGPKRKRTNDRKGVTRQTRISGMVISFLGFGSSLVPCPRFQYTEFRTSSTSVVAATYNCVMSQASLEDRIATLEREIDRLRRRLGASDTGGKVAAGASNWVEAVAGSMANDPEFQEVVRLGRAARQADRPADDGDAPQGESAA
jgi:uncharacterized small protein (DUF1192 family)